MCPIPTKDEYDALEALMDRIGVVRTLDAVATICHQKADFVRSDWQDNALAKQWDHVGQIVSKCAAQRALRGK